MPGTITTPDFEDMFDIEEDARRSGGGVIDDPYPVWAELLARGPVHSGPLAELMGRTPDRTSLYFPGFRYFSVFSFAGVSEVFTRSNDFGSEFYQDIASFDDSIIAMDGLKHRRFRDLIQEHFQPATASGWWREKIVTGLVEELVSQFTGDTRADLNSQLFARLPMRTVTAGFGLSPSEGLVFRQHILASMATATPPEGKQTAARSANAILERVIRLRKDKPQDDIISRLAQAELKEEDGASRTLTVEEIVAFCRLIVFAGGGTTWKQLGITTFALLNNPEQLEAVKADRSLLPAAVLESTRWYPNDPVFPRKARRDTVLQGTEIPAGSVMHLCLGSANRDPDRWEDPEEFDIFRPVQRSVAFAAGAHSCLGQHVAREEMFGALNVLFDRFPNIRWDSSMPPPKLSGSLLSRGPGPLHVLLD